MGGQAGKGDLWDRRNCHRKLQIFCYSLGRERLKTVLFQHLHGNYSDLGVIMKNKGGRNSRSFFLHLFLTHTTCSVTTSSVVIKTSCLLKLSILVLKWLFLECFLLIFNPNVSCHKLVLIFSVVDKRNSLSFLLHGWFSNSLKIASMSCFYLLWAKSPQQPQNSFLGHIF